MKHFEKLSLL